jgi:hypothetical protein
MIKRILKGDRSWIEAFVLPTHPFLQSKGEPYNFGDKDYVDRM